MRNAVDTKRRVPEIEAELASAREEKAASEAAEEEAAKAVRVAEADMAAERADLARLRN